MTMTPLMVTPVTGRRAQTNFTAAAMTAVAAKEVPAAVVETTLPTAEPVPDGTAMEIIEWVGSDIARAERALNVEESSTEPRKRLVATLRRMVERGDST